MVPLSRPHFRWQLRSRELLLGERTAVMAILNLTPDSFSGDGLLARGTDAAVQAACDALDKGADLLDLGAESTRPGAEPIGPEQEQDRLLPVLESLLRERPQAIVSVDTYHAATALAAARAGAEIVNDVSGLLWDREMASAVAQTGCGLVLMHTRGRPPEWRGLSQLGRERVVEYVREGLAAGLATAAEQGIRRETIVLDPGFAFGKLGGENLTLLAGLPQLASIGYPLLVGMSRKGFLGSLVAPVQTQARLMEPPSVSRREITLAANVAAALGGAHILRVHDVQATREAVCLADALLAEADH